MDLDSELVAVRQHPDFGRWVAEPVSSARPVAHLTGRAIASIAAIAFSIFVAIAAPVVLPVAALVAGVALAALIGALRKARTLREAAVEHCPAYVASRREQVVDVDENSTNTFHFATLHLEGGQKREFPLRGPLVSSVAVGDVGLAVLRDTHLLDFKRCRSAGA